MATRAEQSPGEDGLFGTQREDLWWVPPVIIAIGFTIFIVYSTFRGLYPHIIAGGESTIWTGPASAMPDANYLSPFFSPCLAIGCHGPLAGLIPFAMGTITPALYILWAPLGFRATCYYYRKAYYRAYFADPPACAVEEPRHDYKGETGVFILQNLHRYFLPFALLLVVFLSYDAVIAFHFADGWHVNVGSLVLAANVVLLGGYTFGCHALRHLVGGGKDCLTCPKSMFNMSYPSWKFVTWFNERHMLWAWLSLFWVGFTDLYVWLVTSGVIHDVRLI